MDMTRIHGDKNIPEIECTDTRLQKYRVRADFQPYKEEIDGKIIEGVSFVETEFPYKPSMSEVKDFVLKVINSQTDYKILTGLVWNDKPVWLSIENQRNFSEGERKAKDNPEILPVTYKIGENQNEEPIYHTFTTVEELTNFYDTCFAYILQCLTEGWLRKDSIDWTPYEEALEPVME